MDGLETRWTDLHFSGAAGPERDENHHLAKVRAAGSNSVFRYRETGP